MQANPIPQVQPIVYIAQKYPFRDPFLESPKNHFVTFHRLGITQIALGINSTVLGIILVSLTQRFDSDQFYIYSHFLGLAKWMVPDIWCGVFFFITGLLGVLSARYKTKCLVVASLSSAVFSSLCAPLLFGFNFFGVIRSSDLASDDSAIPHVTAMYSSFHITQVSIGVCAFVCSIVHASYCCNCCGTKSSQSSCLPSVQPTVSKAILDSKIISYQSNMVQSISKNPVQTGLLPSTQQLIQQPTVITSSLPQQQSVHELKKQHTVSKAILDPKIISYQSKMVQSISKNSFQSRLTGILPSTQQLIQQPTVITSSLPQQQSVHELKKQPSVSKAILDPKIISYQSKMVQSNSKNSVQSRLHPSVQQLIQKSLMSTKDPSSNSSFINCSKRSFLNN